MPLPVILQRFNTWLSGRQHIVLLSWIIVATSIITGRTIRCSVFEVNTPVQLIQQGIIMIVIIVVFWWISKNVLQSVINREFHFPNSWHNWLFAIVIAGYLLLIAAMHIFYRAIDNNYVNQLASLPYGIGGVVSFLRSFLTCS
jgi:hypothetical protein